MSKKVKTKSKLFSTEQLFDGAEEMELSQSVRLRTKPPSLKQTKIEKTQEKQKRGIDQLKNQRALLRSISNAENRKEATRQDFSQTIEQFDKIGQDQDFSLKVKLQPWIKGKDTQLVTGTQIVKNMVQDSKISSHRFTTEPIMKPQLKNKYQRQSKKRQPNAREKLLIDLKTEQRLKRSKGLNAQDIKGAFKKSSLETMLPVNKKREGSYERELCNDRQKSLKQTKQKEEVVENLMSKKDSKISNSIKEEEQDESLYVSNKLEPIFKKLEVFTPQTIQNGTDSNDPNSKIHKRQSQQSLNTSKQSINNHQKRNFKKLRNKKESQKISGKLKKKKYHCKYLQYECQDQDTQQYQEDSQGDEECEGLIENDVEQDSKNQGKAAAEVRQKFRKEDENAILQKMKERQQKNQTPAYDIRYDRLRGKRQFHETNRFNQKVDEIMMADRKNNDRDSLPIIPFSVEISDEQDLDQLYRNSQVYRFLNPRPLPKLPETFNVPEWFDKPYSNTPKTNPALEIFRQELEANRQRLIQKEKQNKKTKITVLHETVQYFRPTGAILNHYFPRIEKETEKEKEKEKEKGKEQQTKK